MIGPTDLLHPSPAPHFKTYQVFLICCPKRPSFSTIQSNDIAIHIKKLKKSVAAEYPERCVAGVYRRRFKILYGVTALSSDVSPYLALGVPLVSGSLVSL